MTAPRVAIVGAGLMGRWHAHAARQAGSRVVTIIDANPRPAQELAAQHRGSVVAATLTEAVRLHAVDVVHICTPLATHAELALEAIEGDCHVLVEKPFTASLAETRRVLDRAQERSRFAIPVHQFPWQRGVRRALALLPTIAPIRHLTYTACSAGAVGRSGRAIDQVAADIVPHPLSLIATLLPGALEMAAWQVQHSAAGEWQALTQHDGTAIELMISMAGRPPVNQLRIIGEGGTLHLDLFHDFLVRESPEPSRAGKILRPVVMGAKGASLATANLLGRVLRREVAYPGLTALVRSVHLAARHGGAAPVARAEILEITRSWDTICEAAGFRH